MNKGRKPKPTDLKKLQGTDRPDRIKSGIEFERVTKMPKPEVWMSDKGKKYFRNFGNMLIEKNMLFVTDIHMLCMMGENMATFEIACRELQNADDYVKTVGENNYQQQNPWIAIRNEAQKKVMEIGERFGLDPLSRLKFGGSPEKQDKNPFGEL